MVGDRQHRRRKAPLPVAINDSEAMFETMMDHRESGIAQTNTKRKLTSRDPDETYETIETSSGDDELDGMGFTPSSRRFAYDFSNILEEQETISSEVEMEYDDEQVILSTDSESVDDDDAEIDSITEDLLEKIDIEDFLDDGIPYFDKFEDEETPILFPGVKIRLLLILIVLTATALLFAFAIPKSKERNYTYYYISAPTPVPHTAAPTPKLYSLSGAKSVSGNKNNGLS